MTDGLESEKPTAAPEQDTDESISLVPPYRVIVHNDDVTPMDFVIEVLIRFFSLSRERSTNIMLEAHNSGQALVAIMPLEQAEFKVQRSHEFSRSNGYALTLTIESAE